MNNTYTFFESNIHPLTPFIADELTDLTQDHGEQWVIEAMKIAARNGKRSLRYITSILERWRTEGYGTAPPWERKAPSAEFASLAALEAYAEKYGVE